MESALFAGLHFDKKRFKKDIELFHGSKQECRSADGATVTSGSLPELSFFKSTQQQHEGAEEESRRKKEKRSDARQGETPSGKKKDKHRDLTQVRAEVDVDRNEAQTLPPMSVEAVALLRKKFRIRVSAGGDIPAPLSSFADLAALPYKCKKFLLRNLSAAGYSEPTPIQRQAITLMLSGRECFACAPTGSGKTVAFLLPILMRLKVPTGELRAIVLSPTRELALQIHREVKKLTRGRKFRVRIMTKTTARCMDFKSTPCDILISTPLRLANLITEDKIDLSSVVHLVLDESDKLFDMGFMEQVDRILEACTNTNLQRSLFSATLPETVEELARSVMHDPVRIVIGERNSAASTVSQRMVFVGSEEGKLLAIRQLFTEGQKFPVLVFVQSKERCKELHKELAHDGIRVDSIHADRTQAQREAVLDNFRRGEVWVLIATDVMARGMDFKGVNTVINYDFPQNTAAYIHRIGRSGRAGRAGEAVTFYTEDDAAMLRPIANIIHASGSEVQPWMLALPKERHRKKVHAPDRKPISTIPKFDMQARKRKREMIEASKRKHAKQV